MRNDLSMREMNNLSGIAGLGRGEDTMLAHVAPGEMVVPPVITPETQKIIEQEMMAVGLDPNEYKVGGGMSINPITGMAEFGFLKKLGKSLKKVVKKVAPIAAVGLGIAGIGGVGPLGGLLGKGAGTATSGKFFGAGGKFRAGLRGLGGSLFGGGQTTAQTIQEGDTLYSISQKTGIPLDDIVAANPGIDPKNLAIGQNINIPSAKTSNIFRRVLGGTEGQSGIGVIEDIIKGRESDFTKERGQEAGGLRGMLPDNSGLMALAALYGKAVKEDYKKKEGGLKDIRQSIRPDLMPAPTFTGFDLGIRPGMSYGGRIDEQELDLRMGGPSIGPGTGTSDDIPAMLSDGEFVMTSAANNGLGGFKITKTETGIELIPNGAPDRQKGAKNMDKLMKTFEEFNKAGRI